MTAITSFLGYFSSVCFFLLLMAPHHISSSASTGSHNIRYNFEITQRYTDPNTKNLLLGLTLQVNNTSKIQV